MRRLGHWLRISLACSVLWAGSAVAIAPVARAEVCCHAAARTESSERTAANSCKRASSASPVAHRASPAPARAVRVEYPARALASPRVERRYLVHCVLLR